MPAELKLIYLKNSTIHTLKISDEDLDKTKAEIIEIWEAIKKAFKEDDFPATKNNLCDWCYYKPICPVFNKNAPDTDVLQKLNEEIKELNDNLEALSMFDNPNDLPKDSPLSNINKGENQANKNTAFICIQQMTKQGEFAGSNRIKHMTTAMAQLRFDGRGYDAERYIEFSKNRRGGVGEKIYFSLSRGGKVDYSFENVTDD